MEVGRRGGGREVIERERSLKRQTITANQPAHQGLVSLSYGPTRPGYVSPVASWKPACPKPPLLPHSYVSKGWRH